MNKTGLLYSAAGRKHVEEAEASARSARSVMPNLPIALYTNASPTSGIFDEVIQAPEAPYDRRFRMDALEQSPFDRTLHVDGDTHFCTDVSEIFQCLDRFDLMMTLAPRASNTLPHEAVPDCFSAYNSGVFLWNKNERGLEFLKHWRALYVEDMVRWQEQVKHGNQPGKARSFPGDQRTLRIALFTSQIRLGTLRQEFNCRFAFPQTVVGPVYILHGRYINMAEAAQRVNAYEGHRICYVRRGRLHVKPGPLERALGRWLGG